MSSVTKGIVQPVNRPETGERLTLLLHQRPDFMMRRQFL